MRGGRRAKVIRQGAPLIRRSPIKIIGFKKSEFTGRDIELWDLGAGAGGGGQINKPAFKFIIRDEK